MDSRLLLKKPIMTLSEVLVDVIDEPELGVVELYCVPDDALACVKCRPCHVSMYGPTPSNKYLASRWWQITVSEKKGSPVLLVLEWGRSNTTSEGRHYVQIGERAEEPIAVPRDLMLREHHRMKIVLDRIWVQRAEALGEGDPWSEGLLPQVRAEMLHFPRTNRYAEGPAFLLLQELAQNPRARGDVTLAALSGLVDALRVVFDCVSAHPQLAVPALAMLGEEAANESASDLEALWEVLVGDVDNLGVMSEWEAWRDQETHDEEEPGPEEDEKQAPESVGSDAPAPPQVPK